MFDLRPLSLLFLFSFSLSLSTFLSFSVLFSFLSPSYFSILFKCEKRIRMSLFLKNQTSLTIQQSLSTHICTQKKIRRVWKRERYSKYQLEPVDFKKSLFSGMFETEEDVEREKIERREREKKRERENREREREG